MFEYDDDFVVKIVHFYCIKHIFLNLRCSVLNSDYLLRCWDGARSAEESIDEC